MTLSRRSFVGTIAALPLLLQRGREVPEIRRNDSTFDPWVEVHTSHLRHNVAQIHTRVGGRPILAVIKNNGYGLGILNVARVLEPLKEVVGFAVVKLHEALTLREDGIRKPILLLGPFSEQELEEMVARNITPMVYTPLIGSILTKISQKQQRQIGIHVCVDTGIGRVGVPHRDAVPLLRDLTSRKGIRIEGIMMTFTEDPEFDKEQLKRFLSLCGDLKREGIQIGAMHAASSFGLFQHPEAFLDMVRPGMAIFGIYPEPAFRQSGVLDLQPAVSLKARVIYVKQLPKGESAGYERAYKAEGDTWVATLPVGHADGVPRVTAKGANVRIGERSYPVVAISASHVILKIGNESHVRVGDEATIFDWHQGSRPEDISAACGASVYDLTMHLNPLLPRRIV